MINKYVGIGVSWVSLITENLLSHPFIVLRRQCQVNHASKKYHIVPVSLLPVVVHLYQHQGLGVLWKGLGSVLLVRGMTLGVEDLLSKITVWPKELEQLMGARGLLRHLLLKCVSIATVTPFFAASLVETVQSEIASERPGMLDVFREGAVRLLHWGRAHGRLLPVWAIVVPTVAYGLNRYLFFTGVRAATSRFLHLRDKRTAPPLPPPPSADCGSGDVRSADIDSAFVSMFVTDVVFYPMETIIHRLHLQGTRTIVDNLDTGYSVLPILTNYLGPVDCYVKTVGAEGTAGLYKGFGALLLQYSVHYLLLRLTRFLITEVTCMLRTAPKPAKRTSPCVIYDREDM